MNNFKKPDDKISKHNKVADHQGEKLSQTGKTAEEMMPYLLAGEPDDLSFDFHNKI